MRPKFAEKRKAIDLRKKGLSYSEIQKLIPVSSSSLSLWLKHVPLTKAQKIHLNNKSDLARKLGSQSLKSTRIEKSKNIISNAKSEIKSISKEDLMLLGITLYWAEGSKQKGSNISKGANFSNSDPMMIKIYIKWLMESLRIQKERVYFEIYIHESHQKSIPELKEYWSNVTGFTADYFQKVYYKSNKIHSIRKNRGPDYNGVLRILVHKSTDLNRKITGWIEGICERIGVA